MNWTRASAIAEIASSIAILATLVFLAVEIGQNTSATTGAVRQSMLASDQQHMEQIIANPELHLSWYKSELNPDERVRLSFFLLTHLRMRENNWLQHKNGILDDVTWRAYRGSLVAVLSGPNPRKWWREFGVERLFDSRFISEVNALISETPVTDRSPHITAFEVRQQNKQ